MTDSDLSPLATPPSLAPLKKAQGARKLVLFLCVGATGVIVNLAVGIATQMAMPNSPVVGRNLGVLLGWTFAVLSNFLLNNSITFGGQAHHKTGRKGFCRTTFRRSFRCSFNLFFTISVDGSFRRFRRPFSCLSSTNSPMFLASAWGRLRTLCWHRRSFSERTKPENQPSERAACESLRPARPTA